MHYVTARSVKRDGDGNVKVVALCRGVIPLFCPSATGSANEIEFISGLVSTVMCCYDFL